MGYKVNYSLSFRIYLFKIIFSSKIIIVFVDFFEDPLSPFQNPIILENTRRMEKYGKLDKGAIMKVIGTSEKPKDRKVANSMKIENIIYYVIPQVKNGKHRKFHKL